MGTESKQVMDIQVSKGIGQSENEQARLWTERGWDAAVKGGNYDRSREPLNFEIGKGSIVRPIDKSRTLSQRISDNLQSRGIKDPNEGLPEPRFRTVVSFIFGGSRERMRELAFGSQEVNYEKGASNPGLKRQAEIENWAKDIYNFVSSKWGEENIASFIVHLDELNPHIHCTLLPIMNNKFAFKKIFGGKDIVAYKQYISDLHNDLAHVNEKWGLNRGSNVAETGARHVSTEEYRRSLSNECSSLERSVQQKSATLSELNRQIRQAEIRLKGLTTMVANLEAKRLAVQTELDAIHKAILEEEMDDEQRNALTGKEEDLQKKLSDILTSLADKQSKLTQADTQLKELQEQLAQAQEQKQSLNAEVQHARAQVSELALSKVGSEALWSVLNEFTRFRHSLPPQLSDQMEDSLLEEMSRSGMNIIACAAMLSIGMVDQATEFAKNCGGGGGHSSEGWGRRPEEDEREWLRRCLSESRKLMRPAGKKIRR